MSFVLLAAATKTEELLASALDARKIADLVVLCDLARVLDWLSARDARDTRLRTGVVILELELPTDAELAVLKVIRSNAETNQLPVVILASSREENDVMRCYSLGANAYLAKLTDAALLHAEVARLVEHWLEVGAASLHDLG